MAALTVLIGVAALLLALGAVARAVARAAPAMIPAATGLLCAAGLVAAVAAPVVATIGGPVTLGVDGLSAAMLAALFLHGAATRQRPVTTGALAFAMLAADGVSLWLATAALVAATGRRGSGRGRILAAVLALAALAAALLLLGGLDPRFAAIRAAAPEGLRGAAILALTLLASGLVARAAPLGGLAAAYLVARLLLDLCGPVTPAWWGIPVLAAGAGLAVEGALRAAAATDLGRATGQAGRAALGLAVAAFGAALLARGADMSSVAALAVAGALLQALCWAGWGGLLAAAGQACAASVGGEELSRMGGLLRRMPATGLAMLVALLSLAAAPATAGFAGWWTALQAVLAVGRAGGLAVVLAAAGVAAALGLAWALLASAAVRLAGTVLLGAPRTAKAAAATEPRRLARIALGLLAALVLAAGAWPASVLLLARPAAQLLTGARLEGVNWLAISGGLDAPGYAAPILTLLLATLTAAAAWAAAAPAPRTLPWQGGFIEDGIGRANTLPLTWPVPRLGWLAADRGRLLLAILAIALAALLGWAGR